MAFLRNPVTTGPGTAVVVESPHAMRAFLLDDYNNYLYGIRHPFTPVDGGSTVIDQSGVARAVLRAPYFATWWLVVDSTSNQQPQASFAVVQDAEYGG